MKSIQQEKNQYLIVQNWITELVNKMLQYTVIKNKIYVQTLSYEVNRSFLLIIISYTLNAYNENMN